MSYYDENDAEYPPDDDLPDGHQVDEDGDEEDGGWTMHNDDADSLWDSLGEKDDDEPTEQPA